MLNALITITPRSQLYKESLHACVLDQCRQHLHGYGPIGGVRDLVGTLRRKLTDDNKLDLTNQEVMVTAGANQVSVIA